MLHALGGQRIFTAQVDISLTRAGDKTANRHAFEYGEGIAFHKDAIFESAGLGFIGIADDVMRAIGFLLQQVPLQKQRFPFFCRGKSRAPTA